MTVKSMTGFGRVEGAQGGVNWHWEVRTVNGRGLDIKIRMPSGHEELEGRIRKFAAQHFKRGNCTININIKREQGATQIELNEAVFTQIMKAGERAAEIAQTDRPELGALLAMRGVLENVEIEESIDVLKARVDEMEVSCRKAIEAVVATRQREGEHLSDIVSEQLNKIEAITKNVSRLPSRQVEFIKTRLREQLARIISDEMALDENRLYQEAAILAQKGDVEEELKRLEAHVAEARGLLQSDEAVGRQLDFLAQEFNREANTLCSKSNDTEMTRLGLDLKSVIEQMREQVQNIE